MAQARFRARAKGGRLRAAEEAAVTIAAYGLWKTLRRERRRTVETIDRFKFVEKERPADRADSEEGRKALLFTEASLAEPSQPAEPPPKEEEARGPDGQADAPELKAAREWWAQERRRQEERPFEAGRVATARLSWREGMRPMASAPGRFLSWGPSLVLDRLKADERDVFVKLLAKDVRSGALRLVEWDEVDVVTPAFIAYHPVTLKPRLVHDLRAVNARLKDSTVALDRAMDALMRGSVAAKLDLAQAFRHVALDVNDRRCLVFVVDGIPFQWQALPFGAGQSPELFAKALAPAIAAVRNDRCTYLVYVDDILIIADNVEELDRATVRLCEGLRGRGWRVALDKCFFYGMGVAPFLGLLVDLTNDVLRVSAKKAQRLQELCTKVLAGSRVSLRDLQRVGGLLAFFATAAPEAALMRSGLNAATAEAERLPGRTVGVKGRLADDLRFWKQHAKELPVMTRPAVGAGGSRIAVATDAAGLPSLGFGGVAWEGEAPAPDLDAALGEVERFAEDVIDGEERFGGRVFRGPIPGTMASASSAALEVYSFHRVLRAFATKVGADKLRGATVTWYCDAQVAVGAVGKWRAKAAGLIEQVNNLLESVRALGCTVVPKWVSREAGWQPVADYLSKCRWTRDTAEWAMPQDVADKAMASASFVPRVDLFATGESTRLPAYVSQYPEVGNCWTDAFTRVWNDVEAYAFPPFSVVPAMMRHMCRSRRARIVAVVPRSTDVPTRLRVVSRSQLPPVHMIDVSGHTALNPCPVLLDVLEVHSPDMASGAGAG